MRWWAWGRGRRCSPPRTTVRIDLGEAGRLAVNLAFDDRKPRASAQVRADPVVRESTAAPRRRAPERRLSTDHRPLPIASGLHIDVDREAPVDSIPLLMAELHARSTSPLNRSRAAESLGYQTRKSFDLRLNRLVRSYGGFWAHQLDESGRKISGAQSKLYLTDPLLVWIGTMLRAGAPEPDMTALTEESIAVMLAAAIDQRQPGRWMAEDTIGYVRTGSGQEVDFGPVPVPSPCGPQWTTPIEAKWVTTGWRADAKVIEGKFGRGVIATKNITRLDTRAWAIPAPLLALLLI